MKRKLKAGNNSDDGKEKENISENGPKQKITKSDINRVRPKEERERFQHSLYRPPTSEELNELKETEDLYKSNLFRLQISYLLEEVKGINKKSKSLEKFMHSLHDFFGKLESTEKYDLSDLSWLPKDVKLPIPDLPSKKIKGKFCFAKPSNVKVVGSYLLKTVTKPNYNVDILLTMPEECFQSKDHLNFRYHTKRAIYLTILASRLKKLEDVESLTFSNIENNPFKPILILKPAGKAGSRYVVKIHPVIPESVFKLSRFGPLRSNVRLDWFEGKSGKESEDVTANPTPKYNASILSDLRLEKHLSELYDAIAACPAMVDAIALFKVWLHQRGFTQGDSCFNGFQMSMLITYLLNTRKISSHMSSYQIFRITLNHIAKSDWTTTGISLATYDESDKTLPSLENFHEVDDVVFVDSSGYLNLCANMRKSTFEQLRREANLAIEILEDSKVDDFNSLFMKSCKFEELYDQWFSILDISCLEGLSKKKNLQAKLVDHGGDWLPVVMDWIIPILRKGLGSRVDALEIKRQKPVQWSIDSCPPKSSISEIVVGLLLNTENAESILDMGPSANDPEALEFRRFWGDKSDLRRFQDGSINEAVVWEANTKGEKRKICKQVVEFLLQRYCKLQPSSITYTVDQFDCLIKPKYKMDSDQTDKKQKELNRLQNSTGEEDLLSVIYTFDELFRQIKNLELPLEVNTIQGIHPVFRMTEVFPPRPSSHIIQNKESKKGFIFPSNEKHSSWCPAIEAMLQFEGSGKWPDDIEAIQYMKAAFYLKLASLLKANCALVAMANTDHVDVLKKGYVFRLRIFHHREMILHQQSNETGAMKKEHDLKAHKIDVDMVKRPLHTTMIYSLHQRFPVYGLTTRLAKRWVSSQMLSDYVCDEVVELLVASLFISPAPYRPPSSQTNGFLRFLTMLQTHDWQANPIVVDLNDSMKVEDYTKIRESFSENRQQLPPMFIATPYDKEHSIWTKDSITHQILRRLVTLAELSKNTLESEIHNCKENIIKIFRPPLEDYDVLIHLNPHQLPRHYQAVDSTVLVKPPKQKSLLDVSMPVVDFDPVQKYLMEIRAAFSDVALFFYDKFGSLVIGVVWKPSSFIPQPFKILGAKYKIPAVSRKTSKKMETSNDSFMLPNTTAILSDFQILGRGLVTDVQTLK